MKNIIERISLFLWRMKINFQTRNVKFKITHIDYCRTKKATKRIEEVLKNIKTPPKELFTDKGGLVDLDENADIEFKVKYIERKSIIPEELIRKDSELKS